jgi:preprotein translocase subunit SecG
MRIILTFIHVVTCIILILVILLQKGKGADMGAAFGGSSQTVFGSSGAMPFLQKLTTVIAIVFMLSSLGLSLFKSNSLSSSVMEKVKQAPAHVTDTVPAASNKKPLEKNH